MNTTVPYESVDGYPDKITGASVIIRMLDGLGYRFRYATEELTQEDYHFSPGHGCQTIGEIVEHIWWLLHWVYESILEEEAMPQDSEAQRIHTLKLITKLRTYFENTDDSGLEQIKILNQPFWNMINGPLSDALTHTGQINTLRRLSGSLPVESDVFFMKKPEGK